MSKFALYGDIVITKAEYEHLLQLEKGIKASLSGDRTWTGLRFALGLCDNICTKGFHTWLCNNFSKSEVALPINLSVDELVEDLALPCNYFTRKVLKREGEHWYFKMNPTGDWQLLSVVTPSLQYTHFSKYSGNMGKARLKLLQSYLEDIKVYED